MKMKIANKVQKSRSTYICDFCGEEFQSKKELGFHKLVCNERTQPKERRLNNNFKEWLFTSFITFKISSNSREIRLCPKWLMLVIVSLSYAGKYVLIENLGYVLLEFITMFIFGGFIWYLFDRARGKTVKY